MGYIIHNGALYGVWVWDISSLMDYCMGHREFHPYWVVGWDMGYYREYCMGYGVLYGIWCMSSLVGYCIDMGCGVFHPIGGIT